MFNQGQVDATQVALIDYIPTGLTLDDTAWTNNGDGTASLTTPIASLLAGDSTTVDIAFTTDADASGQLDNWAEIAAALDGNGDAATDIDSTPDIDTANDTQPTGPNEPTDDETGQNGKVDGDEDDHDIASVNITPFDLALTKQLADGTNLGVVDPGDEITFTLEVFNQGAVTATSITLVDYMPAGLQLADSDWALQSNGTATIVIPGPLEPGESIEVDITTTVRSDASGTIDNIAEIVSALDGFGNQVTDIDSIADSNPGDQLADDEINNGEGDEDDSDIAQLEVRGQANTATETQGDTDATKPGASNTDATKAGQGSSTSKNLAVTGNNIWLSVGAGLFVLGGLFLLGSHNRRRRLQNM